MDAGYAFLPGTSASPYSLRILLWSFLSLSSLQGTLAPTPLRNLLAARYLEKKTRRFLIFFAPPPPSCFPGFTRG